jgi:UPF0755 protein
MAEPRQRRSRRRRRSGFIEIVNGALSLLVLAILVVGGLVVYGAHMFYADTTVKADTDFVVKRGTGMSDVAGDLEDKHLISNRWVFQLGGVALHKQRQLKAGEFRIAAGSSMADIWHELTEGKPIEFGITIPEGFTSWQVVSRLNEDNQLTGQITALPPEGSVLPQTYNYEPGMTRQSVLERMQAAMKDKVAKIWADRDPDLPFTSPQQLVTLASIVEKETGVPGERSQVAAVFINRLEKHMRLQSDPTIIYGITKGQGALGRPLKKSEIEAATAYNTYQIDGLPPTPIANPGADALMAAAHPAKTEDIYFVAAGLNPSDGHLFAASYAEHRKNVAKLRRLERQQAAAPAEEDTLAAEDQLEQQQAKAAGDTTADSDPHAPPAPADKAK